MMDLQLFATKRYGGSSATGAIAIHKGWESKDLAANT